MVIKRGKGEIGTIVNDVRRKVGMVIIGGYIQYLYQNS